MLAANLSAAVSSKAAGVALGGNEVDAYFGDTGLEHVASCNRICDDRNRLRVSLLITDPSHPQRMRVVPCAALAACKVDGGTDVAEHQRSKNEKFRFLLSFPSVFLSLSTHLVVSESTGWQEDRDGEDSSDTIS